MRVCGAIVLSLLASVLRGVHCDSLTPLIAWSNSDALSRLDSSGSLSVADFVQQLNLKQVQRIVVFNSPKLSFDDLVRFGGAYGEGEAALRRVQMLLQSSTSSYWNGVESFSVSDLKQGLGGNIKVVDLPEASSEDGFSKHDAIIGSMVQSLESEGLTYLALYTAGSSRQVDTLSPRRRRAADPLVDTLSPRRRRAADPLEASSDLGPGQNSNCGYSVVLSAQNDGETPCLILCLRSDSEQFGWISNNSVVLYNLTNPHIDPSDLSLMCNGTIESSFKLQFNDSISVTFTFPQFETGFWSMELYAEDEDGDEIPPDQPFRRDSSQFLHYPFRVPFGLSYTCSLDSGYNSYAQNNTAYSIELIGIQVQPYYVKFVDAGDNTVFGSAYNCQGYWTTASWMGTFSVLIGLLLLYLATVFVFSIQTLDRFDDAKDPTITIENLH